MSDIGLNPLSVKQRKLLQVGVVLILVLFLVLYVFVFNKKAPEPTLKNNSVYIENSTLYIFDDTYPLSQYPDKVSMHYPYLLVLKPSQQINYIYNLQTKIKVNTVAEALLDYDGNNTLYNQGKTSFLNSTNLGVLCDLGFIKSENEVLCVTKVDPNFAENKLIIIKPSTKKQTDVYASHNLITAISVIDGITYLGVNDLNNGKNYLLIDKNQIEFPDVLNLIYEYDLKAYVGSLISAFNNNTESYYLIDGSNIVKQEGGKILLFK